jgi:hypothetical protein
MPLTIRLVSGASAIAVTLDSNFVGVNYSVGTVTTQGSAGKQIYLKCLYDGTSKWNVVDVAVQ